MPRKIRRFIKNIEARVLPYSIIVLMIVTMVSSIFMILPFDDDMVVSAGSGDYVDWLHYKVCSISNANNSYQMWINISYDGGGNVSCEGNCNTNFSDIRFSNSTDNSSLDYWIEKKVDGSYAWVWVETSSNVEDTNKIILWYGNATAINASNPDNTFPFYFDEDDDGIWTGTNCVVSSVGDYLLFDSAASNNGRANATIPSLGYTVWAFEFKGNTTNQEADDQGTCLIVSDEDGYYDDRCSYLYFPKKDDQTTIRYNDGGSLEIIYDGYVEEQQYIFVMAYNESDTVTGNDYYVRDVDTRGVLGSNFSVGIPGGSPTTANTIFFGDFSTTSTGNSYIDWGFFRKYTMDTQPSWSGFGDEDGSGLPSEYGIINSYLDNGNVTWSGLDNTTLFSNETGTIGKNVTIYTNVNVSENCTDICIDLSAQTTLGDFNEIDFNTVDGNSEMYLQVGTDETWSDEWVQFTNANSYNISLNTSWDSLSDDANPFTINNTMGNITIHCIFKLDIQALIGEGTYTTYTDETWLVKHKYISTW